MTISQFIEKAIEGGWKADKSPYSCGFEPVPCEILLDPLAWKAVGKVEGWGLVGSPFCPHCLQTKRNECNHWESVLHRFISRLAGGLTIEESLEDLTV